MSAFIRLLNGLANWLEHRFPEKMTTRDVMSKFVEYETRLAVLERRDEIIVLRNEIQKLKLVAGIASITGINGHQ